MLGCILEGNQLRHCTAKSTVQLAIIANKWVFIPGPTKHELDTLPIKPLGLKVLKTILIL